MYLESYYYHYQLSCNINEMKSTQGCGSNMQIHMVTQDLVEQMQANGKVVAIWPDDTVPPELYQENEEYFKRAYDLGVKMITTDYPERAHEILQKHHAEHM